MNKISFIHLSDIHFVKTSNNPADIDNDLRDAILTDLQANAKARLEKVHGILVTGDIAFSGSVTEYEKAKEFLGQIADLFGMQHSDIYCVPGNHDVDQSIANGWMVSTAQNAIDICTNIDSADRIFEKICTDPSGKSSLFEAIQRYNDFAGRYGCSLSSDNVTWEKLFELDFDLKLRLFGMNSCFLSNRNDHQADKQDQLMYIGQAQIPKNAGNTATVLMCHHPPECWRFYNSIKGRLNARADVQLYGHMHTQSITLKNDNAFLFSGATHPQRSADWSPCYNWITIGCTKMTDDRILELEIFPRILSEDRNRFCASCNMGEASIKHSINIDDKRRRNVLDPIVVESPNHDEPIDMTEDNPLMASNTVADDDVDERELIYRFYELPYVRQVKLLCDNELYSNEYSGMQTFTIIKDVVKKARENGQLQILWESINSRLDRREK